jgi:hypothetical protein
MKKNYHFDSRSFQRATEPTVFVTKSRQRVKQYDGNVIYLKNGEQFELELFNPKSEKVLAKISLNGKSLGSGIILRPGERVFLERYLDEAKKFLFETYEIEGNDSNAVKAIANNGSIEVEFYDEYKYSPYTTTVTYTPYQTNEWPWWNSPYYTTSGVTTGTTSLKSTNLYNMSCTSDTFLSSCCNNKEIKPKQECNCSNPIETGRVEKGGHSDQSFVYDSTSFQNQYTTKVTWKILPESQKVFAKEDLKIFCVECGTRRKKSSHRFCPNCGTKFNN